MANILDQARTALNRAQPADVEEATITELPEGGLRIEIVLKAPAASMRSSAPSKWARFADALHRDSPLQGHAQTLCQHSRAFRDSFSFDAE